MNNLNEGRTTRDTSRNGSSSHVGDAATELLNEGKKFANELYADGLNKMNDAETQVREYSDQLLKKVQDNPLSSILIAAGAGIILSSFFKK